MRGCPAPSPSSRRAWVEISSGRGTGNTHTRSPSSRRAWVEILSAALSAFASAVALLAEGVGRNSVVSLYRRQPQPRPPRGGRG